MASYAWLADQLDIPIVGPESLAGKHHSRADWVKAGACDILRAGVPGVGGISPTHEGGAAWPKPSAWTAKCTATARPTWRWSARSRTAAGTSAACCTRSSTTTKLPAYLNSMVDPMDADGFVHLSQRPGLGEDINFEYIETHTVSRD